MLQIEQEKTKAFIAQGIMRARKGKFATRRALCQEIGKADSQIAHIELGNQLPRLDQLLLIAVACEASLDDICKEAIAAIKNGGKRDRKNKPKRTRATR